MMDDQNIEMVNNLNILGLFLDGSLSWKSHVEMIAKRISKCLSILNILTIFLPLHTLKILYNSFRKTTVFLHNPGVIGGGYQQDMPDLAGHQLVEELEPGIGFVQKWLGVQCHGSVPPRRVGRKWRRPHGT